MLERNTSNIDQKFKSLFYTVGTHSVYLKLIPLDEGIKGYKQIKLTNTTTKVENFDLNDVYIPRLNIQSTNKEQIYNAINEHCFKYNLLGMSNSIREFKNNDELIKELENRNLIFIDEDSKKIFKKYLIQYGYFAFIKKLSHDLMYDDIEKKTYKKEFDSNHLRYLFDVDRNISVIIFKYFRNIEFLLNSSLLKIFAKHLNKKVKCPYIATLDAQSFNDLFPNLNKNISIHKRKMEKGEKSDISILHSDLYKNIRNEDIEIDKIISDNKKKEKSEIIELINNGWFNKSIKNNKTGWEYIDFFHHFKH